MHGILPHGCFRWALINAQDACMSDLAPGTSSELAGVFPGHTEMAQQMRAFDWESSALGLPALWPESLRGAVRLCLSSRIPILLWWGPDFLVLYNDAYLPFLSERKRSRALLRPGHEVWSEIWETIAPMLEQVVATGEATSSEELEFFFDRKVPREEVLVSFSYNPILAADGHTVQGIFSPCQEYTEKVVGARRLDTLCKLGVRSREARTIEAACQWAAEVLGENPRDVPFAAIYVVDQGTARLTSAVGPAQGHVLPDVVSHVSDDPASTWPLAHVLRSKQARLCDDLAARSVQVRGNAWPEPIREAMVLPIQTAPEDLTGLLIMGVSPRRPLDPSYRAFFEIVASHIAAAIADARDRENACRRAEQLAELDRAKTAFFSHISHEFRTPLSLILGPLEDALQERPSGTIETAHRNALRLLRLVNSLLDFSLIQAGGTHACFEPVDLSAFTAELAAVFRAAVERAGLTLRVDCPALDTPVYVDGSMWEKIVLNLLSNALKFTFAGTISVELVKNQHEIELRVSDTGTGIPQQELPRLFERFHRIEGARGRTFEGSGLGLALVHELVKLHSGALHVESVEGSGSRITVSIPLGCAHLPREQVGAPAVEPSTATHASVFVEEALRWLPDVSHQAATKTDYPDYPGETASRQPRARILIADENADLRQYLERLLSPRHELELASDGRAALEAARRNLPELIVADVTMPVLGGFGLLAALNEDMRTRRIPVILLSACAGEESRIEGLEKGAADYVVKPFSARELLARVDAQLEIARLNRQSVEREQRLREAAEQSEAHMRAELLAELAATTRLHELSTRLLDDTDLQPLLSEVLDACMAFLQADLGNVQLYEVQSQSLRTIAQRGFAGNFLQHFERADLGSAGGGRAFETRARFTVRDVLAEPSLAPHLPVMLAAGVRAVQSTPLISRNGEPLGVLSMYFRRKHAVSQRDLRLLDMYARQAAEMIEHRQARDKLRRSDERFRRYFDLGLIGGALTSSEKGCLEVNDELCRILGYSREELLEKNWAELTHPDDLAQDVACFERALAGEIDGYTLDKRWIRKDGGLIESIVTARAVRRTDGSVDYFVGLVQDITERKRAMQELQRLQHDLAHVSRVTTMGEMASSIAHELNQPLAAIAAAASACVRWLGKEPADLAEAHLALEYIARDAKRASDVIARIRSFVQRRVQQHEPLDFAQVMNEATAMAEADIRRHAVLLSVVVEPALPPVCGDRVQLQQVILNLLQNAVEAMDSVDDRPRTLDVKIEACGADSLKVAVRDCGIGIERERRDLVFDAFHTTKARGMGMGLAISRSIIDAHGGKLWATANAHHGETFHLILPIAAQARPS